MVWLDVLDLPLVHYLEASYHVDGPRQRVAPAAAIARYARAGLLPTSLFQRSRKAYPMLRYPWAEARAALEALAGELPPGRPCRSYMRTPRPAAGRRTFSASTR